MIEKSWAQAMRIGARRQFAGPDKVTEGSEPLCGLSVHLLSIGFWDGRSDAVRD